jgi:hypothetical protein
MSTENLATSTGTVDAGTPAPVASTATTGTATAGTQTETAAAPVTSDTSSQTPAVEQAATSDPQAGEATAVNTAERPANPWETDDNPYKKRFNDVLPHSQRLYQENQQLTNKFKQLEEQVNHFRQQESQRAQQLKLKDWHPRSPNYQQTKSSYDKVNAFIKAKNALPESVRGDETTIRSLAQGLGVTPEDAKLYHQVETDREMVKEQLLSDPEAFFDNMFESRMMAKFQEFEQFQQARTNAQKFLEDPKIQPLIQQYAGEMDRMMDPSVPGREKALMVAQLMAENEAMRSKLGQGAVKTAQAEAQQALRQGVPAGKPRGAASRQDTIEDPFTHFSKKGLKGTDLAMAIARHNASNKG